MKHRCEPLEWREIERAATDGAELPFRALFREAEAEGLFDSRRVEKRPARPSRKAHRGILSLAREQLKEWFGSARRPAAAL